MIRLVVAALFLAHGLVHSMGAVKAFGIADVSQLKHSIPPVVGVLWLSAMLLCLAAALTLFVVPRWWWAVGAAAVLSSQTVIDFSWADAGFGTVVNVALLAPILYGFAARGPFSLHTEYQNHLKRVWPARRSSGPVVTEADLASLPDPVQRYLRRCDVVGRPPVSDFRATWTGRIRSDPSSAWMTFTADQLDIVDPPRRFFWMDARMKGLPVDVLHVFDDGGATMRVRLLSVRSMADAGGPTLTRAETVTLFNDFCCYAPSALTSADISWDRIDASTAVAHFTLGTNTVTAELHFDDNGDLVNFVSDDRSATSTDGCTYTPLRWSTPLGDYAHVGPARVPTKAVVRWHPDSGPWTYGEFALTALAYNVAPRSIRAPVRSLEPAQPNLPAGQLPS